MQIFITISHFLGSRYIVEQKELTQQVELLSFERPPYKVSPCSQVSENLISEAFLPFPKLNCTKCMAFAEYVLSFGEFRLSVHTRQSAYRTSPKNQSWISSPGCQQFTWGRIKCTLLGAELCLLQDSIGRITWKLRRFPSDFAPRALSFWSCSLSFCCNKP